MTSLDCNVEYFSWAVVCHPGVSPKPYRRRPDQSMAARQKQPPHPPKLYGSQWYSRFTLLVIGCSYYGASLQSCQGLFSCNYNYNSDGGGLFIIISGSAPVPDFYWSELIFVSNHYYHSVGALVCNL